MSNKPIRSDKIRNAANGEPCTMQGPYCNYDSSTVVFCHSNSYADGKGKGQKAHDIFGFFGCSACHDWFDGSLYPENRSGKYEYFHEAMKKTWLRLIELRIIKVEGIK